MRLHSQPLWFKFIKDSINKMLSVYYCSVFTLFWLIGFLTLTNLCSAGPWASLPRDTTMKETSPWIGLSPEQLCHTCTSPTVGQWVTKRGADTLWWDMITRREEKLDLCTNGCFDLANVDVTNAANGCTALQSFLKQAFVINVRRQFG